MALFFSNFPGFNEDDFKAFEPKKHSSNRYNLERMKVREKLDFLGKSIAGGILQAIKKGKWGTTEHVPSLFNQRKVDELSLYFTRPDDEQRLIAPYVDSRVSLPAQIKDAGEHMRNLNLFVRIYEDGVDVGLRCHSTAYVDVMNLLAGAKEQPDELFGLLRKLGEDFMADIGQTEHIQARNLSVENMGQLDERVMDEPFMIRIYKRFSKEEVESHKEQFKTVAYKYLSYLTDLYVFWLWTRDNDRLSIAKEITKAKPVKKEEKVTQPPVIEEGMIVRIVSGLFKGKKGRVLEIEDRKGMVKLAVGKLTVRVSSENLKVIKKPAG